MPVDPIDEFHRELEASQGNYALKNQDIIGKRSAEALHSKNFRSYRPVESAMLWVGVVLLVLGLLGLLPPLVDLIAGMSMDRILRDDLVPTVLGIFLMIFGSFLVVARLDVRGKS